MKKALAWLNGRKTQIGLTASLTVGYLLNTGAINEVTGNYLLALLGVWGMIAVGHREVKRKQKQNNQSK